MEAPLNTIMIVEPDERVAALLAKVIRGAAAGMPIEFFREGFKALAKLESHVPLVLITAHGLRDNVSGRQLVEAVLRDPRHASLQILVTSTPPEGEFSPEAVSAGRLQFLAGAPQEDLLERAFTLALHAARPDGTEYTVRTLQPNEPLFLEGEKAEHAFLVKSGKLRAFRTRDGKAEVLGEILPGEFVGEMAYIDGEPRSASVDALLASELIEIPLRSLDTIIEQKPAWSKALLKTLSRRLKGANNRR